jgi:hypothetical protein
MASGPDDGPSRTAHDPSGPVGTPTNDIFPSYSRRSDHVRLSHLHDRLRLVVMPRWRQERLTVFRYRNLPKTSDSEQLDPTIREAMDHAAWFMLLASVSSAASIWVGKEIEYWLDRNGTDRMMLVVTEGGYAWDAATGDFDTRKSSAVHSALRGVFTREPPRFDMRWMTTGPWCVSVDRRLTQLATGIAALVLGCDEEKVLLDPAAGRRLMLREPNGAAPPGPRETRGR